jgi:hypothetical protein
VNQKRMKRMRRSSTIDLTSSAVRGWSATGVLRSVLGSWARAMLVEARG